VLAKLTTDKLALQSIKCILDDDDDNGNNNTVEIKCKQNAANYGN
jgi:hypothetical protein